MLLRWLCPPGLVHTKNFGGAVRLNLTAALHSLAVDAGPHRIDGIVHLGGAATTAVATPSRDDKSGRCRSAGVGYLAYLAGRDDNIRVALDPPPEPAAGMERLRVDRPVALMVRVQDVVQVPLLPPAHPGEPRRFVVCQVTDINAGDAAYADDAADAEWRPPVEWWRGDVLLRPGQMRLAASTGEVDLEFLLVA